MEKDKQEQDCAICLQKYHHPTQLPCGHVFCFLCVKGIAIQSKKCAMCRTQIPRDYFDHPVLLEKQSLDDISTDCGNNKYQWYYEGRNGWWKYEERSNADLEVAYCSGGSECLLLLAGTIYCVDFQNMVQIRRSDPTKLRKVKRDIPTFPSKGIAGIKNIGPIQTDTTEGLDDDVNTNNIQNTENEIDTINATNESLDTADISSIDDLTNRIRDVTLQQDNIMQDDNVIHDDNIRQEDNEGVINQNNILSSENT